MGIENHDGSWVRRLKTSLLLTADAGRDSVERCLPAAGVSANETSCIPSVGALPELELLVQLGEIAMASSDERVRSGALRLFSRLGLGHPLAEAWRARLESVVESPGAGGVEVSEQPPEGGRR